MTTITFGKPYRKYKDNDKMVKAFGYPFTVTRHATGAEYDKVAEHEIEVSASKTLASIWGYSESDLERVLFEYGRRYVEEKLQEGELKDYEELELHTAVTPEERLYNPKKIPNPEGATYQFGIAAGRRKIGFELPPNDE